MKTISYEHLKLLDVLAARREKHKFHMSLVDILRRNPDVDNLLIACSTQRQMIKTASFFRNQMQSCIIKCELLDNGVFGVRVKRQTLN